LVLIFFDDESRVISDKKISEKISDSKWDPNFGGTNFGKPLKDAFAKIN